ncbi:hypothetical protein AAE478_007566 [Parahypoxylon ruwenzoriense]
MSSPIAIKVAVSPARPSASTPANKRKIIPSAEQCSSKWALILTTPSKRPPSNSQGAQLTTQPFFAPRQLFLGSIANVVHEYTHVPNPSPREQEEEDKAPWHARHVLLPFDLRDRNINIFEGEVHSLLYDLFPGTTNITEARYRSHLFQVRELPSSPWPLTVGSVPITILAGTSQGRASMFPRQNLGNLSVSICGEYAIDGFSDRVLRELAASVDAEFRSNLPGIRIVEIMFTCERTFYIVLGGDINVGVARVSLPGRIANCPVGYLHDRELHRPFWVDRSDSRQMEPQPRRGIFDDTLYDVLRPGVMICSKMLAEYGHPAVLSMTFQNSHSLCHLNSPYTGNMEGSVVMKSIKLEATSTRPTDDGLRYVVYNWSYMGHGEGNEEKARPPNGTCGSVIWDDDGVVLGFYHYCIDEGQWAGFSRSVSASEVVEAGYDLAK